jgi:hypothetical protein
MSGGIARFARKKTPLSQDKTASDKVGALTSQEPDVATTDEGFGGFGPSGEFCEVDNFGGWGEFGVIEDTTNNHEFDSFLGDDLCGAENFDEAELPIGFGEMREHGEKSSKVSTSN